MHTPSIMAEIVFIFEHFCCYQMLQYEAHENILFLNQALEINHKLT